MNSQYKYSLNTYKMANVLRVVNILITFTAFTGFISQLLFMFDIAVAAFSLRAKMS